MISIATAPYCTPNGDTAVGVHPPTPRDLIAIEAHATVAATIKLAHTLRMAEETSKYSLLPVEMRPGYSTVEPGDGLLQNEP